jgi:cyclohexanone monooxygenase
VAKVKADYPALRAKARARPTGFYFPFNAKPALEATSEERRRQYEDFWASGGLPFLGAYGDLLFNKQANDTIADFAREKIRGIVKDPATAEALAPKDHPIGTKRICVDTHYYETYNRPNVALVNLRETPIDTITAAGIRTSARDFDFDVIVFATGFDAMTGALLKIDFEGRGGRRLSAEWEHGPRSYLGLMVAAFPNLFMITGPGSPSVLSNMIVSIEQHVDWIAGLLGHMQARGLTCIEATEAAQADWVRHGMEVAEKTLYPSAASWYMGANIPGKPRVFMPYIGGVGVYRQICNDVAAKGYEGFVMTAAEPSQKRAAS